MSGVLPFNLLTSLPLLFLMNQKRASFSGSPRPDMQKAGWGSQHANTQALQEGSGTVAHRMGSPQLSQLASSFVYWRGLERDTTGSTHSPAEILKMSSGHLRVFSSCLGHSSREKDKLPNLQFSRLSNDTECLLRAGHRDTAGAQPRSSQIHLYHRTVTAAF